MEVRELQQCYRTVCEYMLMHLSTSCCCCIDDEEEQGGSDEEDYGEEEGGGSDDDDTSWKVRKAAVKVISAVVQARPDLLPDTYALCGAELVRRFKEREENVRLDILACYTSIVQASAGALSSSAAASVAAASSSSSAGMVALTRQRSASGDFPAISHAGACDSHFFLWNYLKRLIFSVFPCIILISS